MVAYARKMLIVIQIIVRYRKEPVKSDTPGQRKVCARTLAPLLVNLRIRFHPWTPPSLTYRVPVTILAPVSICFLNKKVLRKVPTRTARICEFA